MQSNRIKRWMSAWRWGLVVLLAGASLHAWADPPARAARVVAVSGSVWYFDTDHKAWERLVRNQTVAQGDHLRVDAGSRLSLRVGSTGLWLDAGGDLEVLQMDDAGTLLRLDNGALGVSLHAGEGNSEMRVQTQEGMLYPEDMGLYRIEQMPQGTRAQTLQGRLRFESDRSGGLQRAWLRDGEQAEFWWADGPRTEHQTLLRDAFTDWLLAQARLDDAPSVSQEYVSPEMTGVEDLDRNGRWEQSPEYGAVWIPTQVAPDWAPYSDGNWVWSGIWGWTWVDRQPWGFAPFHYGRWVQWGGRWCWTPGHYVARPVYAPALVTWNQAPGVSISMSLHQPPPRGTWKPLPPHAAYVPGYAHSQDYDNRLNRPHDGPPAPGTPHTLALPAPREVPSDEHRPGRFDNGRAPSQEPWAHPAPVQHAAPPTIQPPVQVQQPARVQQPVQVQQPAPAMVRLPEQVRAPEPAQAGAPRPQAARQAETENDANRKRNDGKRREPEN